MRRKYLLIAVSGICVAGLAVALIMIFNLGGSQRIRTLTLKDGDTATVQSSNGDTVNIRYASINTPGRSQTLGETAWRYEEQLIRNTDDIVVDLKPAIKGKNGNGLYGRRLAYVFLDMGRDVRSNLSAILVSKGYARLDVRSPCDTNIKNGDDFDIRYAEEIIEAQIKAAMTQQGWWGQDDKYAKSDVAIAVIKQWSDDEVVYIVNRSKSAIDFAGGWRLVDNKGHELSFCDFPNCILLPGGIFRVHSGPAVKTKTGKLVRSGSADIDLYWRGDHVWNQDDDTATLSDPTGATVYSYTYPFIDNYWK